MNSELFEARKYLHLLEVAMAAKVLGDGDRVVQVEDGVVPAPGHEDCVAGVLHEFIDLD